MIHFEKRAPLEAHHLPVKVGARCPLCNQLFRVGDVTTSVPVHELQPDLFACAVGHWTCAERVRMATLAEDN